MRRRERLEFQQSFSTGQAEALLQSSSLWWSDIPRLAFFSFYEFPILIFTSLQLSNVEARLASFQDWPAELKMRPEELAEAGFFHDPYDEDVDQVIPIET